MPDNFDADQGRRMGSTGGQVKRSPRLPLASLPRPLELTRPMATQPGERAARAGLRASGDVTSLGAMGLPGGFWSRVLAAGERIRRGEGGDR